MGETIKLGIFMIKLCTSYFTVGVIFVNPLCFLIVHKNDFSYFTALHFLGTSLNIWYAVGFDIYISLTIILIIG